MGRVLGLPLLIVALAAGVYLGSKQIRSLTPADPPVVEDTGQAQSAAVAANFTSADTQLQAWFASHRTYAGALLPDGSGVYLVRADSSGYCLQTDDGIAAVQHELGPNGTPLPGPC
jgi:hypothetical protein